MNKNYINNYHTIQNTLYSKSNKVNIINCNYDKKILDNKQNLITIKNIIQKESQKNLLIAKTNSGKTYTILKAFNLLAKEDPFNNTNHYINIVTVPNRAQAQQIEQTYGINSIVGDTITFKNYFFEVTNTFCCVYDKLIDVMKSFERYKDLKVRLVIDECHNLITSLNYRRKTINNVEKVCDKIIKNGGSVTYMTATYEIMLYQTVDNIIDCQQNTEYKANTDNFIIYRNNSKKKFENVVYNVIKDKNCIVRYNSLNTTDKLINSLIDIGKNVKFTNSDEKGYYEDNNGNIKYYNDMTDSVINNEELPDCDLAFTTSMLDCGTNITNIKNRDNYNFESIFAIQDCNNMSLLNIEQFFNRIRFKNKQYSLIIDRKDAKEYKKFLDINKIICNEFYILNKYIKYFNLALDALKFKYTDDNGKLNELELRNEIESQFNYITSDKRRNDMYCIYLNDDLEIDYDRKLFYAYCYNRYDRQFYMHQDKLVEKLKEIFNIDVKIVDISDDEVNNVELKSSNIDSIINDIYNDDKLINQIDQNDIKDDKIKKIIRTKEYKDIKDLKTMGASTKEAIKIVNENDTDKVDNIKRDKIKNILKTLTVEETNVLSDVINNKKKLSDIRYNKTLKSKVKLIINIEGENIIKLNKISSDINNIINIICNVDNIDKYIKQNQYIENNKRYLNDANTMAGKAGIEQKIILDFFIKDYDIVNNKTKRTKITKNNISDLVDKLNKYFGVKKYTYLKVANIISNIFIEHEVKYNNKKTKEIVALKLKNK